MVLDLDSQQETPSCEKRVGHDGPPFVYVQSIIDGAELDLFWQHGGKNWGIEFKYLDAPKLTKSMHSAMEDLDLEHLWVVYPGNTAYRLAPNSMVIPLSTIKDMWEYSQ